jgi:hypothetical protein
MVRSIWTKTLIASLAWAGLAWAQQPASNPKQPATPSAVSSTERVITLQEPGKPAQKCKVLKTWKTPEGATAYQVQALAGGEIMTIVESGPATTVAGSRNGTRMQAMATLIFHWGRDRTPPPGTPMPPAEVVQTVPPAPRVEMTAPRVTPQAAPVEEKKPGFFSRFSRKDDCCPDTAKIPVVDTKITASDKYNVKSQYDSAPSPTFKERMAKLFSRDSEKQVPVTVEHQPVEVKSPTVVPAAAPKVTTSVTAAPPSDWRQSWGKPEEQKITSLKPLQPEVATKTVKELPRADTKLPDPLQAPERYSKQPIEEMPRRTKQEAPKPVVPDGKATSSMPAAGQVVPAGLQSVVAAGQPLPAGTQSVVVAGQPLPAGMQSVVAAGGDASGVTYIPVPVVTIPDVSHPPITPTGPQTQVPRAPQLFGQAGQSANAFQPVNKALGPTPTTYDPGLVNAFTAMPSNEQVAKASNAFNAPEPGSFASLPTQMARPGPAPYAGNAAVMTAQTMPGQGLMPVGYQTALLPQGQAASAMTCDQMLSMMRDSFYPSHREWAAESMAATVDWRANPKVVDALLTSARGDPAASVRAACVRCLVKMNVNTVPAVTTIQALKADPDPRVRQEVEKAMAPK